LIRDARAARAQGKDFSSPISCPGHPATSSTATPPEPFMKGRLLLLTDNFCFSSCLVVTDDFRRLGAFHVGQTTDAATRFTEVREEYLCHATIGIHGRFSVATFARPPTPKITLFIIHELSVYYPIHHS
jgi:hypothetical protein